MEHQHGKRRQRRRFAAQDPLAEPDRLHAACLQHFDLGGIKSALAADAESVAFRIAAHRRE